MCCIPFNFDGPKARAPGSPRPHLRCFPEPVPPHSYNFQIISVAMMIPGYVYPETKDVWTATESTAKTMAVVGAIFGT